MAAEGRGEENVMMKEKGEELKKYERKRKRLVSDEEPATQRPVRERKAVERFSFPNSVNKGFIIKKGPGIQLQNIPNVAYNLSKRKAPDSNLQMLHTILFRKKSNKYYLKRNISHFSGFVWAKNEGKKRAKLEEKINKCVKEMLFDFCEFLDIPVSKASKKVELSAKLMEFLESPHATTKVALDVKEQHTMNDIGVSQIENHNDESDKEDEEQDDSLPEKGGSPYSQSKIQEKEKPGKENTGTSGKLVKGFPSKKEKTTPVKKDSTSKSATKKSDDNVSRPSTSKSKVSDDKKSKVCLKANAEPSQQEMLAVVSEILRTVDLDHVTLNEILMELEAYYNTDLSHRKAEVGNLIEVAMEIMITKVRNLIEEAMDDLLDTEEEGDEEKVE